MSRESCIQHRKSQRLILMREDYRDLFDGDHCASAVLSLFEHLTNNELQRMELAEESEEPWIRVSMVQVINSLMELYSDRTIQKRIDWIVEAGILEEAQQRIGKVKQYLLRIDHLNSLLGQSAVIGKFSDGGNPTSEATSEATSETVSDERGGEKPLRKRVYGSVENLSPTTSPTGENPNPQHTSLGGTETTEAPQATRRLLGRSGFFGKKPPKEKGVAAKTREWVEANGGYAKAETAQGAIGTAGEVAELPAIEPEASQPSPKEFIRRWNKAIPERAIEFHTAYNFRLTLDDPEFAAKFDQILAKVRELYDQEAEHPGWWLTFDYLLKSKDGMPNWRSVLNRRPKPKPRSGGYANDVVAEALASLGKRDGTH